jgi:hypothetical protein
MLVDRNFADQLPVRVRVRFSTWVPLLNWDFAVIAGDWVIC